MEKKDTLTTTERAQIAHDRATENALWLIHTRMARLTDYWLMTGERVLPPQRKKGQWEKTHQKEVDAFWKEWDKRLGIDVKAIMKGKH